MRTARALLRWQYEVAMRRRRARARRRGQELFVLGGSCEGCARCCEQPSLRVDGLVWTVPRVRRIFLWWQERANGWVFHRERRGKVFEFRCLHFDPGTRRCLDYDERPAVCRDYPRLVLESAAPTFFEGCGFRAVARNADGLSSALEETGLDPAKLAELKSKLRLE